MLGTKLFWNATVTSDLSVSFILQLPATTCFQFSFLSETTITDCDPCHPSSTYHQSVMSSAQPVITVAAVDRSRNGRWGLTLSTEGRRQDWVGNESNFSRLQRTAGWEWDIGKHSAQPCVLQANRYTGGFPELNKPIHVLFTKIYTNLPTAIGYWYSHFRPWT